MIETKTHGQTHGHKMLSEGLKAQNTSWWEPCTTWTGVSLRLRLRMMCSRAAAVCRPIVGAGAAYSRDIDIESLLTEKISILLPSKNVSVHSKNIWRENCPGFGTSKKEGMTIVLRNEP